MKRFQTPSFRGGSKHPNRVTRFQTTGLFQTPSFRGGSKHTNRGSGSEIRYIVSNPFISGRI